MSKPPSSTRGFTELTTVTFHTRTMKRFTKLVLALAALVKAIADLLSNM